MPFTRLFALGHMLADQKHILNLLLLSFIDMGFTVPSKADVQMTREPLIERATLPTKNDMYSSRLRERELDHGTLSTERVRSIVYWAPAALISLGSLAFLVINSLDLGEPPSLKHPVLSFVMAGVNSFIASSLAYLVANAMTKKYLLYKTEFQQELIVIGSEPSVGKYPAVTKQLRSLLFARKVRIKNKRGSRDYRLSHLSVGTFDDEESTLIFEKIRVALEPADPHSSDLPVTTSLFKVRPKTRWDCLADFFSLLGRRAQ